jgi:hypothetical protein
MSNVDGLHRLLIKRKTIISLEVFDIIKSGGYAIRSSYYITREI